MDESDFVDIRLSVLVRAEKELPPDQSIDDRLRSGKPLPLGSCLGRAPLSLNLEGGHPREDRAHAFTEERPGNGENGRPNLSIVLRVTAGVYVLTGLTPSGLTGAVDQSDDKSRKDQK